MATITWTDKTDATVSGLAESQKVTAATTAEIKSVVNTNMGLITDNANDIFSLEERSGTTPASFDYLSATTASDPGSGKFKLNHTAIELATHIYVSANEEFRDISSLLDTLAVDSVIYIQDRVSPANSGVFKVVSFVDNTTWYDITMTVESVSLAFSTSNFYSFSVFTKATTVIGTGTVTSVIAGAGMTQSGTSTIDPTMNVIAGDGILVNANNVEIDYDGVDNFIEVATGLEGTDIDPADRIVYTDDDDKIVKRGLVSDLPFADDFTPDAPITLAAGLLGHMNTDGSKHVPANSTTNDGNVLTSTGIAGDYEWKTPSTLPTLTTRTGSTLVFDAYAEYNAITPVTSGNITINPSGAVAGSYVGFYINSATEPTISGAVGQVESGTFAASQINIFHFFWNTNGKYVLNIQNEAVAQTQLTTPTVAAVAGDTLIDLTFSAIDSNATLNVLDVSTDDITYVNEAGYDGTSLTYQDTGLTNTQIYYYRLKSQASGYIDSAYGTDNATPAAAGAFLLDTYTTATGAYSLRKLKTGETLALRVKRDADNAETDILLETDGTSITMASLVSVGGTLSTWIGSDTARVTTWYDQSGSNNDLIQLTEGDMPRFVQAGTLQVLNVLSAIWFAGIAQKLDLSGSALFGITNMDARSIFIVNAPVDPPSAGETLMLMGGGTASEYNINYDYGVSADGTSIVYDSAAVDDQQDLVVSILPSTATDLSDNKMYVNNVDLGVTSADTTTLTTTDDFIGTIGEKKKIQELVIFPDDQTSNRAAIQTEINTHYSVY